MKQYSFMFYIDTLIITCTKYKNENLLKRFPYYPRPSLTPCPSRRHAIISPLPFSLSETVQA